MVIKTKGSFHRCSHSAFLYHGTRLVHITREGKRGATEGENGIRNSCTFHDSGSTKRQISLTVVASPIEPNSHHAYVEGWTEAVLYRCAITVDVELTYSATVELKTSLAAFGSTGYGEDTIS